MLFEIKSTIYNGNYLCAIVPDHPNRYKDKYVLLHRVVMENHLGRLLTSDEIVHHIDEDPSNNDISNLQVMSRSEHNQLHKSTGRCMADLQCPNCLTMFTIEARRTYKVKKTRYTTCSRACGTRLDYRIRMEGGFIKGEIKDLIDNSIIRFYNEKE